jgi:hypothetical protein
VRASPLRQKAAKGVHGGQSIRLDGGWCAACCVSRWGWVVGGPKGFDAHAGRGSAGLPVRLSRGFQGREKGAGRNAAEIIRRTCAAVCRRNGNYRIRQSSRWQINLEVSKLEGCQSRVSRCGISTEPTAGRDGLETVVEFDNWR